MSERYEFTKQEVKEKIIEALSEGDIELYGIESELTSNGRETTLTLKIEAGDLKQLLVREIRDEFDDELDENDLRVRTTENGDFVVTTAKGTGMYGDLNGEDNPDFEDTEAYDIPEMAEPTITEATEKEDILDLMKWAVKNNRNVKVSLVDKEVVGKAEGMDAHYLYAKCSYIKTAEGTQFFKKNDNHKRLLIDNISKIVLM